MIDLYADAAARQAEICHLCAQIAGDPEGDLLHKYLGADVYQRTVCGETADFVVIPSIGALVPGHVLVTPKRHVRSFATLPARERDRGDGVTAWMAAELASVYGQPVHRFEHGSAQCGTTIACSVEHAHLHLVPTDVEVWPLIENAGTWIELGAQSLAAIVGGREYLLYERPEGQRLVWITDETPITSQFMRQAFAAALGSVQEWDWRSHPRPEEIRATLARLSSVELHAAVPRARVSA